MRLPGANMAASVGSAYAGVVFVLLGFVVLPGSAENTRTVEFNVKPGGMVHSFSEKLKQYECSFTYASQGGTNEQWQMSVGLSEDETHFSCSVWRPQGKSYLFFMQFKAEVKGAKIEYAKAFSQSGPAAQQDVALSEDEYTVGDAAVSHREGKFKAALSKLSIVASTKHDEL